MKDGQKCYFCNEEIKQTKEVLFKNNKKNYWVCKKCNRKLKKIEK